MGRPTDLLFGILVFALGLASIYLIAWAAAEWVGVGLGIVVDFLEEIDP